MKPTSELERVTVQELQRRMERNEDFLLIDVLPPDLYAGRHIPGAKNACVFQVVFPAQVEAVVTDRDHPIVVYGSSRFSHDAVTAAEKLERMGFQRVALLDGGIKAWQDAGLTLEGADPGGTDETAGLRLDSRTYTVDTTQSSIEWSGRNIGTKHNGIVSFSGGEITVQDGGIGGVLEIDMESIQNKSLEGDPLQPVLIGHLKSDDFFFVERFPKAIFTITSAPRVSEPTLSAPNFNVEGTLELRGVKGDLKFPATVNRLPDGGIAAEAHFDFDRTLWKIIYGSSRYFEHLGMHLVFDPISIEVRIVAR